MIKANISSSLPSHQGWGYTQPLRCLLPEGSLRGGSQMDLATGMETVKSLSSSSTTRSSAPSQGSEACSVVSSPRGEGSALWLSSSDGSSQSVQYEELVEVITHAVAKLNVEWPAEKQAEPTKSKLEDHFLRSKPLPPPPR